GDHASARGSASVVHLVPQMSMTSDTISDASSDIQHFERATFAPFDVRGSVVMRRAPSRSVGPVGVDAELVVAVPSGDGDDAVGPAVPPIGVVVGAAELRVGALPSAVADLHDDAARGRQSLRRVGLGVQAAAGPRRDLLAGGEHALALEDAVV